MNLGMSCHLIWLLLFVLVLERTLGTIVAKHATSEALDL